jgi:hypothetical protein
MSGLPRTVALSGLRILFRTQRKISVSMLLLADVRQAALQFDSQVHGVRSNMHRLARFSSQPLIQFVGYSGDGPSRMTDRHPGFRPALRDRNRLSEEICDLLPALECRQR